MKRGMKILTMLLAVLLAVGALGGAVAESTEAMAAYRKFLSEDTILWVDEKPLFAGGVQFMTEDLNGDGVPELIVHNREYPEFGRIGIYTYHGFVDAVGGGEELGFYYPGTGVIVERYIVTKTSGEVSKVQDLYIHLGDAAELPDTRIVKWRLPIGLDETLTGGEERYYWQGLYAEEIQDEWAIRSTEPVSREDFEAHLSELIGGVSPVQIEAAWVNNNEENRNQYLK